MSDYILELRELVGSRPLLMPAAGVVVINQAGQILLQKRQDNNLWGLPGGAVEPGEKVEAAARREVEEEVGLEVENLKLFNVYSGEEMYHQYPNGDQVYIIASIFTTQQFNGDLTLGAESKAVDFFAVDDLPAELHPPDKNILQDVRQKLIK